MNNNNRSSSNNSSNRRSSRQRKPLYPNSWGSGNVSYIACFQAYSLAVIERHSLEIGDKIILPSEALASINRLRLPFPLIFEIRNVKKFIQPTLSAEEILEKYKQRIVTIYRSVNPTKVSDVMSTKLLLNPKYKKNPHALYLKICKKYSIQPKPKITADNSRVHRFYKTKYSKEKQTKNKNSIIDDISIDGSRNSNSKADVNINKKNTSNGKRKSPSKQFCSVYEFSSPKEHCAYIPHWMMQNLGLQEGDKIEIQSQFDIQKGTFCKLKLSEDCLNRIATTGFKGTLEHALRHYSALSLNQRLIIEYNAERFDIVVAECKPSNVISILGSTDLNVEFLVPEIQDSINKENNSISNNSNSIENDDNDNNNEIIDNLRDLNLNGNENENNNNNNNDHNFNDPALFNHTSNTETVSSQAVTEAETENASETVMDAFLKSAENDIPTEVITDKNLIDGKLLTKLGIPLHFVEQNDLSQTIVENRIMLQENKERLHVLDEHSDIDGNSDDNRILTDDESDGVHINHNHNKTNANANTNDDDTDGGALDDDNEDEDVAENANANGNGNESDYEFDSDNDSENLEENVRDSEEKLDIITDDKLTPAGPPPPKECAPAPAAAPSNDIQCENCQKYINPMSYQMHSIHCMRNFMKCRKCNEAFPKNAQEEHEIQFHQMFECLCSTEFKGKRLFDEHQSNECLLRLLECKYCFSKEITAMDHKSHERECSEELLKCNKCKKDVKRRVLPFHDCGALCILCGDLVKHSRDLLLHMLTDCMERRAICNYCGTFRPINKQTAKEDNMVEHQKYCGSRSEQCDECLKYVTLANMEKHLISSCTLFTNKQNATKAKKNKQNKNKKRKIDHSLIATDEINSNPYLDSDVMSSLQCTGANDVNDVNMNDVLLPKEYRPKHKSILNSLGSSTYHSTVDAPNDSDIDVNNDALLADSTAPASLSEVCPHCETDILFDDYGEFSMHMATTHTEQIDDALTQEILHRLQKSNLNKMNVPALAKNNNIKKKKKTTNNNRLSQQNKSKNKKKSGARFGVTGKAVSASSSSSSSSSGSSSASNTHRDSKNTGARWPCAQCTYANSKAKRFCVMCNARKPYNKLKTSAKSTF